MKSIDYTNYLPIGKVKMGGNAKLAKTILSPRSITEGSRIFEKEAMAFKRQQAYLAQKAREEASRQVRIAKDYWNNTKPVINSMANPELLRKFLSNYYK